VSNGGFGAFGELAFGEIPEEDSLAGDAIPNVISLQGTDGYEYLVILQPWQRPAET
jgi:hypothetical protein